MDSQKVAEVPDEDRVGETREPRPPARVRRWLLLLLAVLAAGAAAAWILRGQADQPATGVAHGETPVRVAVAEAATADLPVYLQALGTVTPLATVTVRTRIDGQLTQVAFREGQEVRKGDFLVQVDPRPYQAALDQAEGQLARDQALLRNAEVDVVRYRNLVAEDSIARQTLDTQESLVRQYRAAVQIDQALVETARLNLNYCRIVSPIDGRVGLRQVDVGNYVQTGDAGGIVVVTQMRPISVVFTIPEDDLQTVLARMHAGRPLPVTAYDRSGAREIASGVLATMDNQVDTATGTIKLKAQFDNADDRLFPNQFVNVRMLVDTLRGVTVVPSAAVLRGSQGSYVYLVTSEETVSSRPVEVGIRSGERTQLTGGVTSGDRVVVDGVDRLRDGIRVGIATAGDQPSAAPAAADPNAPATAPAPPAGAPARRGGG